MFILLQKQIQIRCKRDTLERLVTTAQAAEILGISLQGVHYRIRNNQLKSIKQSGKTYVYISDSEYKPKENQSKPVIEEVVNNEERKFSYEKVLEAKDEQIDLLKKSIKWMRHQYQDEIKRLEKNQKRIVAVFDSEIKLLQSAFNEMKNVYKPKAIEIKKDKFISLLDFTSLMKSYKKSDKEIKIIILRGIKDGDERFVYDKQRKKVLILNADFSDFQ